MKKAILAVSFGTAYPGALEQSVAVLERTLAEAFPGWEIRRTKHCSATCWALSATSHWTVSATPTSPGG